MKVIKKIILSLFLLSFFASYSNINAMAPQREPEWLQRILNIVKSLVVEDIAPIVVEDIAPILLPYLIQAIQEKKGIKYFGPFVERGSEVIPGLECIQPDNLNNNFFRFINFIFGPGTIGKVTKCDSPKRPTYQGIFRLFGYTIHECQSTTTTTLLDNSKRLNCFSKNILVGILYNSILSSVSAEILSRVLLQQPVESMPGELIKTSIIHIAIKVILLLKKL